MGWAVRAFNDRHFSIPALEMALKRPCQDAGLLHHSDQSCTCASKDDQGSWTRTGITLSMSRRCNRHDDAVMESFLLDREERPRGALLQLPTGTDGDLRLRSTTAEPALDVRQISRAAFECRTAGRSAWALPPSLSSRVA